MTKTAADIDQRLGQRLAAIEAAEKDVYRAGLKWVPVARAAADAGQEYRRSQQAKAAAERAVQDGLRRIGEADPESAAELFRAYRAGALKHTQSGIRAIESVVTAAKFAEEAREREEKAKVATSTAHAKAGVAYGGVLEALDRLKGLGVPNVYEGASRVFEDRNPDGVETACKARLEALGG